MFPIPYSEIEYDETVVLTLLPGAGYGLGTLTVATGTILNNDYLLDLVLDGLPEESAPPPNELSPGAILPIGGGRKRLDIVVESPGDTGTITLTALTGADKITLWDAETGGQQVQPGAWQVGEHPDPVPPGTPATATLMGFAFRPARSTSPAARLPRSSKRWVSAPAAGIFTNTGTTSRRPPLAGAPFVDYDFVVKNRIVRTRTLCFIRTIR